MDVVSKYKPKEDNERKLKCYLNKDLDSEKAKILKQYGKFNR